MATVGHRMLANFYASVEFANPTLAADIRDDVAIVELYGLGADKSGGKDAADRLRRVAFDLPVIHARVLDSALSELGF